MEQQDEVAVQPAPAQKRGRGRPRSAALEERILRAALDALAEDGFPGLNVERICARAGVPRATFYRRWSAPVDALVDALKAHTRDFVLEDTGDLAADLFVYMKRVIAVQADPIVGVCRAFVTAEARIRPDIADPLNRSGREKSDRDRKDIEDAMLRQGLRGPLSAGLVLNAVTSVAFSTLGDWEVTDGDMKALIAVLLGRAPEPAGEG
jgi:AcrR family transcriptional regulator